jgi:hypothetical protein
MDGISAPYALPNWANIFKQLVVYSPEDVKIEPFIGLHNKLTKLLRPKKSISVVPEYGGDHDSQKGKEACPGQRT